ncbi:MAG: hypothetical protein K6F75_10790 [Butyrivibrio sp.]|nr:hypothetical protein [Butyrivibrio sp.]
MTAKDSRLKYFLFIISAALFLMLATRSSFLYVFNNWDDVNSYFSVGKSLFNGKVPYRDVFDQKGMYLYFIYGLAYLVSHTSFIGVYIVEVIVGSLDIIGFYKILKLYVSDRIAAVLAPLSFVVMIVSQSFWWGGAAEELCLPLYIFGLYLIIRYFLKDYESGSMGFKQVFLGGIFAGVVANIKFTGLGFFFAWMMVVFFAFLVHREFVRGIKACFVFLFGMFVPFIPWIIYFAVNRSLYDWYWGYVYINVFLYPNTADGGLYDFIYSEAKILYWLILDNLIFFVPVIAGLFYSIFARGQKLFSRFVVVILFGFTFLGIFAGGRTIPYYSLPLGVFAVFGFALLGKILDKLFKDVIDKKSFFIPAYLVCSILGILMTALLSMNVSFMSQKKEDFFLFRFRDEVLEKENPTLLNIGCLDAGLYTLTDIVPSCRWFQTQTLDVPKKEDNPYYEQERYIKEALTDFVIARDSYPAGIKKNYELIDQADYSYSGYDFTYYLFRKK